MIAHKSRSAGFHRDVLAIDAGAAADAIARAMRDLVIDELKKRGVVVGLSGGIDSSATAGLAVRAFGPERVLGVLMPESESADDTLPLSREVAEALGIEYVVEDITPVLRGARAYERRDDAIRTVLPGYGAGWRSKIVLPSVLDSDVLRFYSVVAIDPQGRVHKARLSVDAYLQIVAATNFKQRTRTMFEYCHADRLNYAVAGTPNRLEYDQGFFVKGGDGLADVKPIAHLYKSQVYAVARVVGVPEDVLRRPPTTDTYSMPQGQDDFYFSLPYELMDLCLWARNNDVAAAEAAPVLGLRAEQVERVYRDIEQKRRTTRPLHLPPLLVESVELA